MAGRDQQPPITPEEEAEFLQLCHVYNFQPNLQRQQEWLRQRRQQQRQQQQQQLMQHQQLQQQQLQLQLQLRQQQLQQPPSHGYQNYLNPPTMPPSVPGILYNSPQIPQQVYQQLPQWPQGLNYQAAPVPPLIAPTLPSNWSQSMQFTDPTPAIAGPSGTSTGYLSPRGADRSRASQASSNASSVSDTSESTPSNTAEMARWGRLNNDGTWSCGYPGCTSKVSFNRPCDLRKHYHRHSRSLFCRYDGCPQATEGGFSSKKDRARHEAKHNPNVACEVEGCDRLFSRVDNMKDHVRRVHRRR